MKKILLYQLLILFFLNFESYSKESFFNEAKNLYNKEKYEESKFLFQRNIVFNPKHSESYLYLAKIFNNEENQREEEKYLNATLLLDSKDEEAMYMLIEIELKRSNFSEVKELTKNLKVICSSFCNKIEDIDERLKNLDTNN